MKITSITTEVLSYPLPAPMWDARQRVVRARTMVLVFVHTDEGLTGMAEAALTGAPPAVLTRLVCEEIGPLVIGMNPHDVEAAWDKVYHYAGGHGRRGLLIHALSGVDVALWDIRGQVTGLPIYRVLGGYQQRVPAYASGGFYFEDKGPQELAEEFASYVAEGFRYMKMKVGGLTLAEDLARVRAVRAATGDTPLAIDANNMLQPKDAIRMARALEDQPILWFEEPVKTDDLDGSAAVAATTSIPIAGYETEHTRFGFRDLIVRRAVDIVQPDVTWTGGFTECRKIAALASAWDLPCIPHVFASGLSLISNLHFIASLPNGRYLEFDRNPNPLRDDLFVEQLRIDSDGCVTVPEGPGLGVTLNPETVARYRLPVD